MMHGIGLELGQGCQGVGLGLGPGALPLSPSLAGSTPATKKKRVISMRSCGLGCWCRGWLVQVRASGLADAV